MDAADLELFERSLRHALADHEGPGLDEALEALGWRDALSIEPQTAVAVLFELLGAENATSSALDQVLTAAAGLDDEGAACLLLPPLGRTDLPGQLQDGACVIRGLAGSSLHHRDAVVVVARDASGGCVALNVAKAELEVRPIEGLDPALGLSELSGTIPLGSHASELGAADWSAAVAQGSLALGHELVGAGRAMLELARSHALERVQFGRPIGSFQAVRHRLSDSLVAIEAADGLLAAAWEDGTPLTASMAKAFAGRSARTAAGHCQQVLAGMGFTAEHPYHRYLRRVMVLDQLLGASSSLTRQLGEDLLGDRRLPSLFPL